MWLYIPSASAPAGAGWNSASKSPAPAPSHLSFTWNGKPMRRRSWQHACRRAPFLLRLSGLTQGLCKAHCSAITFAGERAAEDRERSSGESPASPTPSPAESLARLILATCGPRVVTTLRRLHPWSSCSSRTSQECLPLAGLNESSLTWKPWVSALRRACSRRRKLALRIVGSGCSSSPTPRAKICGNHPGATDSLTGAVKMLWKTPHGFANTDAGGKTAGAAGEMVKQAVLWQTPNTCERGAETKDSKAKRPKTGGIDLQTEAAEWDLMLYTCSCGAESIRTTLDGPCPECGLIAGGNVTYLSPPSGPPAPHFGEMSLPRELWATPAARDHKSGQASDETLNKNARPLNEQACLSGLPAPPTPTDGDTSSQRGPDSRPLYQTPRVGPHGPPGQGARHGGQPKGKRLNPAFVEWLMGWPLGWATAEPSACGCSETASFLSRRRTHLSALLRRFGDAETRRSGRHRDAETQRGGREADDDER